MALQIYNYFAEMQSGKEEGKGSKAGPAQAKAARGKPKAAQAKKKMKEMSGEVSVLGHAGTPSDM